MSDPYPFDQPAPAAMPLGPPTFPPPRDRHPLGLPAGSVRAMIILMIMGTIWVLLLMPGNVAVPLYLWYLLFLTTGAYFAGRSRTKDKGAPPLYLPRGSVRGLIVVGFFGIVGYAIYKDPSGFFHKPMLSELDKRETMVMPTVMFGLFLIGVVVNGALTKFLKRPEGMPSWYQDVQAWISVLAVLGLGAQVILELVVFPSMASPPSLPHVEMILGAVVAFYFGVRA